MNATVKLKREEILLLKVNERLPSMSDIAVMTTYVPDTIPPYLYLSQTESLREKSENFRRESYLRLVAFLSGYFYALEMPISENERRKSRNLNRKSREFKTKLSDQLKIKLFNMSNENLFNFVNESISAAETLNRKEINPGDLLGCQAAGVAIGLEGRKDVTQTDSEALLIVATKLLDTRVNLSDINLEERFGSVALNKYFDQLNEIVGRENNDTNDLLSNYQKVPDLIKKRLGLIEKKSSIAMFFYQIIGEDFNKKIKEIESNIYDSKYSGLENAKSLFEYLLQKKNSFRSFPFHPIAKTLDDIIVEIIQLFFERRQYQESDYVILNNLMNEFPKEDSCYLRVKNSFELFVKNKSHIIKTNQVTPVIQEPKKKDKENNKNQPNEEIKSEISKKNKIGNVSYEKKQNSDIKESEKNEARKRSLIQFEHKMREMITVTRARVQKIEQFVIKSNELDITFNQLIEDKLKFEENFNKFKDKNEELSSNDAFNEIKSKNKDKKIKRILDYKNGLKKFTNILNPCDELKNNPILKLFNDSTFNEVVNNLVEGKKIDEVQLLDLFIAVNLEINKIDFLNYAENFPILTKQLPELYNSCAEVMAKCPEFFDSIFKLPNLDFQAFYIALIREFSNFILFFKELEKLYEVIADDTFKKQNKELIDRTIKTLENIISAANSLQVNDFSGVVKTKSEREKQKSSHPLSFLFNRKERNTKKETSPMDIEKEKKRFREIYEETRRKNSLKI